MKIKLHFYHHVIDNQCKHFKVVLKCHIINFQILDLITSFAASHSSISYLQIHDIESESIMGSDRDEKTKTSGAAEIFV